MESLVPDLAEHDVSPTFGFLPQDGPCIKFKDPYYQPWDSIISKLPSLIKSKTIEQEIEALPLLGSQNLVSEVNYKRAYVVLAFLAHAYVWTNDPPKDTVPVQISQPFLEVCEYLDTEPVLSYAGLCLWNWKFVSEHDAMELDNLQTLASFTGTRDEAAFYLVPVVTEWTGGYLVQLLLDSLLAADQGNLSKAITSLCTCSASFRRMGEVLAQLYTSLNAHTFFHVIRPFLAGGKGMEEKGLPQGMKFKRADGSVTAVKSVGGNAGQSSLFQFLDLVLGVKHEPLAAGGEPTVFEEMRAYMPGKHRKFLEKASRLPTIRSFVEDNPVNAELREAFETCLEQLRSWRGKHIAVVSKYIVQPARAAEKTHTNGRAQAIEMNGSDPANEEWELQGTGGSPLIPFLRQARDETT